MQLSLKNEILKEHSNSNTSYVVKSVDYNGNPDPIERESPYCFYENVFLPQ
jgi:hypothetical protein